MYETPTYLIYKPLAMGLVSSEYQLLVVPVKAEHHHLFYHLLLKFQRYHAHALKSKQIKQNKKRV